MSKKIFVCDDYVSILEVVRDIFTLEGFQVETVQSADKVMEKLDHELPDLLLMDLLMPRKRGEEILRELRKNNRTSKLPVVIFSADPKGRERALNAGANAFIAKPFDVHELVTLVNLHLQPSEQI